MNSVSECVQVVLASRMQRDALCSRRSVDVNLKKIK